MRQHYRPLESPMVEETGKRVLNLINELYQGNFIDEMTKEMALSNTNSASNTDILHLTKIHKPTTVGRPIIPGCDGPTEKLSCLVDKILQPRAQQQKSYLKGTTDFINFIEKSKLPKGVILVSMDVISLYTNIAQEEGMNIVCTAYDAFYNDTPRIPKRLLEKNTKIRFARKLVPIQQTELLANTRNRHGH